MKLCPICATSYPASHRTCPTHGTVLVETPELPAGTMIRDCYRIERMLGKGGMGIVYLAEHTLMGEPRALKFLAGALASNPSFVQRFLQEARAANKLHHQNIAQTYELGQAEDGSFYISMEFVDGPSLRAILEQSPRGLPPERAFNIIRGVGEALGAAHAKRMVHRDIKPENILLAWTPESEVAKVVDFGIVAMSDSVSRLTQTGRPMLTAEYAAPEQWRGMIPASELDGRTDLYSLGCMFYETLTGSLPFHSDSYEGWFEQHVTVMPLAPSQIRPELAKYTGLDALVLQLLAKEREQRPANTREFLSALDLAISPRQGAFAANTGGNPNTGGNQTSPRANTSGALPPPPPAQRSGFQSGQSGSRPGNLQPVNSGQLPPGAAGSGAFGSGQVRFGQAGLGQVNSGQANSGQFNPGQFNPGQLNPGQLNPPPFIPPQYTPVPFNSGQRSRTVLETPGQPMPQPPPPQGQASMPPPPPPPAFVQQGFAPGMQGAGQGAEQGTGQGAAQGNLGQPAGPQFAKWQGHSTGPGFGATAVSPARRAKSRGQKIYLGIFGGLIAVIFCFIAVVLVRHYLETKDEQSKDEQGSEQSSNQTQPESIPGNAQQNAVTPSPQTQPATPRTQPGAGSPGRGSSMDTSATAKQAVALYTQHQYAQAAPLFREACNDGNADSCDYLGWMYQHQLGVEQDSARAVALYNKACLADSMAGCNNLGYMYQEHLGVAQDFGRAQLLYSKACDANVATACDNLGKMYEYKLGVAQDYSEAARLYGKACDGGSMDGCKCLGHLYENKLGVDQDYPRAVSLYTKACNGDIPEACRNLGWMYENKMGVTQDLPHAVSLYSKACDGGEMDGCNDLGYMYQHHSGVEQNNARALELYSKACDGGVAMSCNNLGVMYQDKEGVPQDYQRAATLYQKACDGGNSNGCSDLGELYRNGNGVPKDPAKARVLLTKGCNMGNQWGCDHLKQLP